MDTEGRSDNCDPYQRNNLEHTEWKVPRVTLLMSEGGTWQSFPLDDTYSSSISDSIHISLHLHLYLHVEHHSHVVHLLFDEERDIVDCLSRVSVDAPASPSKLS